MYRVLILCIVVLLFVPNGAWAQGEPLGPEFQVNTATTYDQSRPSVASDASGNFVVVWYSGDFCCPYDIFGQRYASIGAPLGGEYRVYRTRLPGHQFDDVASIEGDGSETARQDAPRSTISTRSIPEVPPR
jgi:hypothetical protein